MPPKTLLDLPREISVAILELLSLDELDRCRRVCAALKSLIESDAILHYKIHLDVEGLVDGRRGGLRTSEHLSRLLERRDRWYELDWARVFPLPAPDAVPQWPLPYELQGGHFFNVRYGGGQYTIHTTTLPSTANPHMQCKSHVIQNSVMALAADATQNLMVALDRHGSVHVWSLSTLAPHWAAAKPVLRQQGTARPHRDTTALHIAHDLVALRTWSSEASLIVWNWKSGRTIPVGSGNLTSPSYNATGFAWLAPRAFVIADPWGTDLVVFSLREIDCTSSTDTFDDIAPCARLKLPATDRGWHIANFELASTPLTASLPPERPFVADPEAHIVAFTFRYARGPTGFRPTLSGWYTGFVHSRYLMSYQSAQGAGEPPKVVPWADWGPENTRVLSRTDVEAAPARYVHGQRVVVNAIGDSGAQPRVTVYDFNVHPKRVVAAAARAHGSREGPTPDGAEDNSWEGWSMELVDTPTVIRRRSLGASLPQPFKEDVKSTLPYIKSSRLMGGESSESTYIMDEERLVESRVPKQNGRGTGSVHVYTF